MLVVSLKGCLLGTSRIPLQGTFGPGLSDRAFLFGLRRDVGLELREADVVLRPKLPGVSGADFTARKRAIQAGRDAALALMAELRSRIAAKTK